MRGQGHTVESVCRVLREQGCQIAARTCRSWRSGHVAARTRTDAEAAATSARIQGAGHLAATIGPPPDRALNAGTGGWTVPLLVVLGATAVFLVGGLLAVAETRRLQQIHDGKHPSDLAGASTSHM